MGLTPEQIELRKGKMTGSRIGALMSGDPVRIDRLYREFIGECEEDNLDDVWAVQLGVATEKLNLDWYERKNKRFLTRRGEVAIHHEYEWAAATIDGWDNELMCPIECKHTGGREPMEIIIDRYQPQMHWQMLVTGAWQCGLSVIMGGNEPIVDFIDRDEGYTNEMLRRADDFMMCVALRHPPVVLPAIEPPKDATKTVNMTGNNRWAQGAYLWITHKDSAENFEDSKKIIKSLITEEVKVAFGHGIRVTRDRRGALHIRRDGDGA